MKYLLDTHTLLWYIDNNTLLPKRAEDIIDNLDNTIYVSVVSLWEIAIKINIKKLTLDFNFDSMISILKSKEFKIYPIKNKHLKKYIGLPLLHKDPYDRLLVATAISEDLIILTQDREIYKYDIKCVWG